jgi:uncharacterized membrane protein YbhN (UPF0104 family)
MCKNHLNCRKLVRKIWKPVFLVLVIFVIYSVLKDSWGNIWAELKDTSWKVCAGIILCSILYNCFDGMAVTKLVQSYEPKFPWYEGILCSFYYSFFRAVSFGSGTAPAGIYYVRGKGIPSTIGLGIFTINYTVQRIAVCLYFIFSFMFNYPLMNRYFMKHRVSMIGGVLLALLVIVVLITGAICKSLHRAVFYLMKKLVRTEKQLENVNQWMEKAAIVRDEAYRLLANKKLLLEVLVLNILKLSAWFMIPGILFYVQDKLELSFLVGTASMMTALVGVIPAPGGVGALEFVFLTLFTPLVGAVAAASGMLLYRASTYLLPFFLGIIVVLKTAKRKK